MNTYPYDFNQPIVNNGLMSRIILDKFGNSEREPAKKEAEIDWIKDTLSEVQINIPNLPLETNVLISSIPMGKSLNKAQIEISGITIPQQEIRIVRNIDSIIITVKRKDHWPIFKVVLHIIPGTQNATVASHNIEPADRTVTAQILYTRIKLSYSKALYCLLRFSDVEIKLRDNSLAPKQIHSLFEMAKIYRKLKVIEEYHGKKFDGIPTVISASTIKAIEFTFQAITKGEYQVPIREWAMLNLKPDSIDIFSVPIERPGRFIAHLEKYMRIRLFEKDINLGPSSYQINKAIAQNVDSIVYLRKQWKQKVNINFVLLDQCLITRFAKLLDTNTKEKQQADKALRTVKDALIKDEPLVLANLLEQPLVLNAPPEEALKIAMDWLFYNPLPNYFFPKSFQDDDKENTNEKNEYEIEIWLSDIEKKKGIKKVGIITIDKETWHVITHPTIEALWDEALEAFPLSSLPDYELIKLAELHQEDFNITVYPVAEAENFIQSQFGVKGKWELINRLIWNYFQTYRGERLKLSDIKKIALNRGITVEDFLSILGLLVDKNKKFIRLVYYKYLDPNEIEEVLPDEISKQMLRLKLDKEKEFDRDKLLNWATKILVGWEPVKNS